VAASYERGKELSNFINGEDSLYKAGVSSE
jgi:hypothetical protein